MESVCFATTSRRNSLVEVCDVPRWGGQLRLTVVSIRSQMVFLHLGSKERLRYPRLDNRCMALHETPTSTQWKVPHQDLAKCPQWLQACRYVTTNFLNVRSVNKLMYHEGQPVIDRNLVSALAGELPVATIILLLEHIAISKCT